MFSKLFDNITEAEKNKAIEAIVERATPRQDFFVMMTLAVSMAAFAILLDSVVILIGSMLIAPLLHPLVSLGLGIVTGDNKLMALSLGTISKSVLLALLASAIIGLLFSPGNVSIGILPADIIADVPSPLMYVVVAVIAGFAAAFAMTKPYLNETLPGVAISVTLVPPLATIGVAVALLDWQVVTDALLLFIVNVVGILFSTLVVFSLLQFAMKRDVTEEAVKEGEEIIKKEELVAQESGKA